MMTKEEFKKRWESDNNGGGITFDDIAKCAQEWGISGKLRINSIYSIQYKVLKAAGVVDCEDYHPEKLGT